MKQELALLHYAFPITMFIQPLPRYISVLSTSSLSSLCASPEMFCFDAHNHIHLSIPGGISQLTASPLYRGDDKALNHVDAISNCIFSQKSNDCNDGEVSSSKFLDKDGNPKSIPSPILTVKGMAIMSTKPQDFFIVDLLSKSLEKATSLGAKSTKTHVIPSYGVHPWFLHESDTDADLDCLEQHKSNDHKYNNYVLKNFHSDTPRMLNSYSFPWISTLYTQLLQDTRACVGEIGLDGAHWSDPTTMELSSPMNRQMEAFEVQLHIAADLNRTVSIHAVQAWGPLMDVLKKVRDERRLQRKRRRMELRQNRGRTSRRRTADGRTDNDGDESSGVEQLDADMLLLPPRIYFHAFGGKSAMVNQLEAILQCREGVCETFYGFAPVINFRSPKTANVIQTVGIDKLVLETDLEDYEGVVSDLSAGVEFIARVLGLEKEVVLRKTFENSMRLYGLDGDCDGGDS